MINLKSNNKTIFNKSLKLTSVFEPKYKKINLNTLVIKPQSVLIMLFILLSKFFFYSCEEMKSVYDSLKSNNKLNSNNNIKMFLKENPLLLENRNGDLLSNLFQMGNNVSKIKYIIFLERLFQLN